MFRLPELAFIYLSSSVAHDGSGIGITPGGHVIHVPGNNPEGYRMVQVGLEMARLSESISDTTLKAETQQSAARLVNSGRSIIEHSLKSIPPEAKSQTA
jgi:hypothetical protein